MQLVLNYKNMFTGIVAKISKVEKVFWKKGSLFVVVKKPTEWKISLGDSISINGVCSTIRKVSKNNFEVEYMPETVNKTTVESFQKGILLNLEKSLRVSDLMDGHIVQGHIDNIGKVLEVKNSKESKIVKIQIPKKLIKFIAPKGSIAIDGTSLTVIDVGINWFTVSLVSYTIENTNMQNYKKDTKVNIETDVIAKYLYNFYKTEYAKKK